MSQVVTDHAAKRGLLEKRVAHSVLADQWLTYADRELESARNLIVGETIDEVSDTYGQQADRYMRSIQDDLHRNAAALSPVSESVHQRVKEALVRHLGAEESQRVDILPWDGDGIGAGVSEIMIPSIISKMVEDFFEFGIHHEVAHIQHKHFRERILLAYWSASSDERQTQYEKHSLKYLRAQERQADIVAALQCPEQQKSAIAVFTSLCRYGKLLPEYAYNENYYDHPCECERARYIFRIWQQMQKLQNESATQQAHDGESDMYREFKTYMEPFRARFLELLEADSVEFNEFNGHLYGGGEFYQRNRNLYWPASLKERVALKRFTSMLRNRSSEVALPIELVDRARALVAIMLGNERAQDFSFQHDDYGPSGSEWALWLNPESCIHEGSVNENKLRFQLVEALSMAMAVRFAEEVRAYGEVIGKPYDLHEDRAARKSVQQLFWLNTFDEEAIQQHLNSALADIIRDKVSNALGKDLAFQKRQEAEKYLKEDYRNALKEFFNRELERHDRMHERP